MIQLQPNSALEEPTVAKAVIAVVTALSTAIGTALADGVVTTWEIVLGVLLAAASGAAVWATTNKPAGSTIESN